MRADLSEVYGVDLAQLVADERYVAISEYIEQLPKASRTWEAILNDPEYAKQVIEASQYRNDDSGEKWAPDYKDWSYTNELLVSIFEALQALTYTTVKVQGGKGSKPKAYPRPRTAIDKAKEQAARNEGNELLAMFGREVPDWSIRVTPEDS